MRQAPKNPIIIIPARMASVRLPGKPLADIHGAPMIVHVWRRAMESKIGPVVVACDSKEIADAVEKVGGKVILTKPGHPSGSDRVWEALNAPLGNDAYDAVINLQGDLPMIDPSLVHTAYGLLQNPVVDIGTLATPIKNESERQMPQIVKAVIDLPPGAGYGRALYFSRLPVPSGAGAMYHHIGLYAYRREALAQFIAAPPSPLEQREKLEQLRALTLGLRIEVGVVDAAPFGVDTPEDLEVVRKILRHGS